MQKINWLEWSESAFSQAEKEKKPVLLDIHGVWCHWCHVMDRETYSDPEIISFVSENFVAVKVDTDKRPDINERYNMGGWPTTAVLSPKGNILNGATYLPANYLKQFLQNALNYFRTAGEALDTQEFVKNTILPAAGTQESRQLIENAKELAVQNFDEEFGGFGAQPKFPMPDLLNFLNIYFFETKDAKIREIMEKTLTEMFHGGMFDQVEGGFFRYSTTQDWSIPHFEKMLEDNSQLIGIYANAHRLFGNEEFLSCSKKTIDYALENLFDKKENYFYGTQDADERYYSLDLAQRKKLEAPRIDRTLFTGWNCLMASNLLKASAVLNDEGLKKIALDSIKAVEKKCFDGKNVFHYFDLAPRHPDNLEDYAALALVLIDAYNYSLEKNFLESAKKIFALIEKKFAAKDFGYYDISEKKDAGLLRFRAKPLKQNAQMAELLLKLHSTTANEKLLKKAKEIIANMGPQAKKSGLNAAAIARAAVLLECGLIEARLWGETAEKTTGFLQKILQNDSGNTVVSFEQSPGPAKCSICRKNVCLKTVSDIGELENYEKYFRPIVWHAGNTADH